MRGIREELEKPARKVASQHCQQRQDTSIIIEGSSGCLSETTIHFRSCSIELAANLETSFKKKKKVWGWVEA